MVLGKPSPTDFPAIGAEKGTTIITGHIGESAQSGAISFHDVQVHEVGFVMVKVLLLGLGKFTSVSLSVRGKEDPFTIRGVGSLCIIAGCLGQVAQFASGEVFFKDVVILIVAPGVSAFGGGLTFLKLLFLFLCGIRVLMGGGEEHFLSCGVNPCAGGSALAGGYAVGIAIFHIQNVYLVEGIAFVALRLKNKFFPIGGEITFATSLPFKGELADT